MKHIIVMGLVLHVTKVIVGELLNFLHVEDAPCKRLEKDEDSSSK